MGPQGSPAIPERHQPQGNVKAAATEFLTEPTVDYSLRRWREIITSLTSYFPISFPKTLCLTCYQVAAWTEWNLLSPLSPLALG